MAWSQQDRERLMQKVGHKQWTLHGSNKFNQYNIIVLIILKSFFFLVKALNLNNMIREFVKYGIQHM